MLIVIGGKVSDVTGFVTFCVIGSKVSDVTGFVTFCVIGGKVSNVTGFVTFCVIGSKVSDVTGFVTFCVIGGKISDVTGFVTFCVIGGKVSDVTGFVTFLLLEVMFESSYMDHICSSGNSGGKACLGVKPYDSVILHNGHGWIPMTWFLHTESTRMMFWMSDLLTRSVE